MQPAPAEYRHLLLQQQIKLSEQYYEDLSLSQQRLKGIRHDMKNHLQSLSWIAARITPKSRETEELQEYLGQLIQDIGEASQILSTGNMGMDAILSLKIGQAKEQKINVHSKISVPKEMDSGNRRQYHYIWKSSGQRHKSMQGKSGRKKMDLPGYPLHSPFSFYTGNKSFPFIAGNIRRP